MKIKLAILDSDKSYLNRIVSVFTNSLSDKIELYSFSICDVALQKIAENKVDVFLASDDFDINPDSIPQRCGFAYFVESAGIESVKGQRAICKFQKSEMIYKEILGIFSEHTSGEIALAFDSDANTKLCTFVSASGGVGCSTVAAACAKHFAMSGKKVLYLNIEPFGNPDLFFSGSGQFDFSDVLFALKSKKSTFAYKLESYVKQDLSGVYFYSAAKNALDIKEMNAEDLKKLISDLRMSGNYEYIIIDAGFAVNDEIIELMKMTTNLVFVSDGSEISNSKFERAYRVLEIIEQQYDFSVISKTLLMYNKFSNKTSTALDFGIEVIGGQPRVENAHSYEIVEAMKKLDCFEKL